MRAVVPADAHPVVAAGGRVEAVQWDELLTGWPRAHLLQSFGWAALQETVGWRARRIAVAAGGGRILPLTVLARGGGGVPGTGPVLYVPKGPACDPGDTVAWIAALAAVEALAETLGAVSVTVEPSGWAGDRVALAMRMPAPVWMPVAPTQPAHTALVDLRGGEDAVLARMRPKGRYNVRLATRRGVEVVTPEDREVAARELGRLCAATALRQGIVQPSSSHLRRTLDLVPTARVHLATVEGEVVAGALVADFAGEAVYLYGGSTARHRERQPAALLHAVAMREAAARGCDRYDLWGVPPGDDPDHPWHGLRQFKLSLGGAELQSAGAWRRVRRPVGARVAGVADGVRAGARSARRTARTFGAVWTHRLQSRRGRDASRDRNLSGDA